MYRLKIISSGEQIANWPVDPRCDVGKLAACIDKVTRWINRFGRLIVYLEAPDGVISIIREWK